jgi:hypothetical protein
MLSDIQFETKEIKYRGQSFTVRGLGLDTISKLLSKGSPLGQLDEAIQEIAQISKSAEGVDEAAFMTGIAGLAAKLPALAAAVIAHCADEPESVDVVERLPLPVQTEALLAIFYLTFDGEDALKNFVSGLKTLMQSLTKAVAEAQASAGQIAKIGTKG